MEKIRIKVRTFDKGSNQGSNLAKNSNLKFDCRPALHVYDLRALSKGKTVTPTSPKKVARACTHACEPIAPLCWKIFTTPFLGQAVKWASDPHHGMIFCFDMQLSLQARSSKLRTTQQNKTVAVHCAWKKLKATTLF